MLICVYRPSMRHLISLTQYRLDFDFDTYTASFKGDSLLIPTGNLQKCSFIIVNSVFYLRSRFETGPVQIGKLNASLFIVRYQNVCLE